MFHWILKSCWRLLQKRKKRKFRTRVSVSCVLARAHNISFLNSLTHTHYHSACRKLSDESNSIDDLPAACRAYSTIVEKMEQKKLKNRPTDPFAGMRAGAAVEAKRAKAEGRGTLLLMMKKTAKFGDLSIQMSFFSLVFIYACMLVTHSHISFF